MNRTECIGKWTPQLYSLMRIVVALLFMQHGTQKLFSIPPTANSPALGSLLGIAGVLEVCGGLLLVLGLFTRPVAFLLSGEMAVAYFLRHAPQGFWPLLNRGELAVLYCFAFLYISAAGGGVWSLDGRRECDRRRAPTESR
jgi:putative oxidoreductase